MNQTQINTTKPRDLIMSLRGCKIVDFADWNLPQNLWTDLSHAEDKKSYPDRVYII